MPQARKEHEAAELFKQMEEMEAPDTFPDGDAKTEAMSAHSEPVSHDESYPEDLSVQSEGTDRDDRNGQDVRLGGKPGSGGSRTGSPESRQ